MPRIPIYQRNAPYEKAVSPQVPEGFLTDQYRALAQGGEAIKGLAEIGAALNEQAQRTELHERDLANTIGQNNLITEQFGNEEWINNHVGSGMVWDYDLDLNGQRIIDPETNLFKKHETKVSKIPISEFMQKWQEASDKIRDDEYAKFKTASEPKRHVWLQEAKLGQTRQSAHIANTQVALSQKAIENAITNKVMEWVNLAAKTDDITDLDKKVAGLVDPAVTQGDLDEQTARDIKARVGGSMRQIVTEQKKQALAIADTQLGDSLIAQARNKSITWDQAYDQVTQSSQFTGREEARNQQQARIRESQAFDINTKKQAAQQILSQFSVSLANKKPSEILDALQKPEIATALNEVDPNLIDTWQGRAFALADRLAKDIPVVTNQIVRGAINDDILKIGRQLKTQDEVERELLAATYGIPDKSGKLVYSLGETSSNNPLLDPDKDYGPLIEKLSTEFDRTITAALMDRTKKGRDKFIGAGFGSVDLTDPRNIEAIRAAAHGRGETDKQLDLRLERAFDYEQDLWSWTRKNAEIIEKQGLDPFYQYADQRRDDVFIALQAELDASKRGEKVSPVNLPKIPERQLGQPTAEELRAKAKITPDRNERRKIYEQGKQLGYWR